ncbi:unnamed protein product [Rotaria sordida]|uniref:B30.2/SPRY domain-containing protein n=1 Tax=Rotaria sordida TaxID=392033 RepID=A0A815F9B3_9BILA|nr:unnamed protein product [Rotaria sordida]
MASSSSMKPLCTTCGNKGVGVFKCEGCSQIFCRKHSNEHRDILIHQLDEITFEHDTLQQTMIELKEKQNDYHHLIEQVNEWEKNSIIKIQRTAIETRQEIEKLIAFQHETISSKLRDLAEQLRKAREDDDFVEIDLRLWKTKLQELKINVTADVHPTVTVHEDPFITLVSQLNIKSITQRSEDDEKLVRIFGSVQIDDNGYVAIQRDSTIVSYVRGKNEYSFGRYKIKFNIDKTELHHTTVFGIISKMEKFTQWPSSCHGWSNDDTYYRSGMYHSNNTNMKSDLQGQTSFTIELLLDCDNRKIQYFNEQTKNMRELNINLEKCPFPWQIFFYLRQIGDRIQLL